MHFYSIQESQTARWLIKDAAEQPILELPIGPDPWDPETQIVEGRRMFYSTYHWAKRGSGSTSPYVSAKYQYDASLYDAINRDPRGLEMVRKYGFKYIVVYPQDYQELGLPPDEYQKTIMLLSSQPAIKKVAEFPDGVIFEITKS